MSERALRFRLWYGGSKRYILPRPDQTVPFLFVSKDGVLTLSSLCSATEESGVIEQATGMVDRNGRDVYEGDICLWTHGPSDIGVVEWRADHPFDGYPNACCYGLMVARLGFCQFQSDDTYEVIGNVHESPHLLAAPPATPSQQPQ